MHPVYAKPVRLRATAAQASPSANFSIQPHWLGNVVMVDEDCSVCAALLLRPSSAHMAYLEGTQL